MTYVVVLLVNPSDGSSSPVSTLAKPVSTCVYNMIFDRQCSAADGVLQQATFYTYITASLVYLCPGLIPEFAQEISLNFYCLSTQLSSSINGIHITIIIINNDDY